MAAGKINLQANDGAVVGLVVPDGLTSGERQISLGVNLSGIAAYHLLQGNLSATINANYVEASATTTRNYTTSDYIFDSLNNKLYDCILASTAGALLTNTTYFTSITAGTLSINNAIIPLAHGVDSNGSKNSIVIANEIITGLTYTAGKNYLYKTDTGYGVTPHKPRYLESELVRTFASEAPEYYDVTKNKWFSTSGQGELVTNGTFTSNTTTGWTPLNSTLSIVNNTLRVTTTANYGGAYQTFTNLVVGKTYRYKLTGSLVTSNQFIIRVGVPPFTLYDYQSTWQTISGSVYIDFIALYTTMAIEFIFGSTPGVTGSIDNVTCFATDIVPTTEITNSRNYLNHIVHADNDGGVLYVEELPKIEYKDIVKANEFKGKNACTMWAILDCTTTPTTIKDSYNVAYVTRLGTGDIEIMPLDLDLSKVTVIPGGHIAENPGYTGLTFGAGVYNGKIRVTSRYYNNSAINLPELSINVYGGKN